MKPPGGTPPPAETVLDVIDIHKAFGARPVLTGLTLSVASGEAVGLFGRDGAGKTVAFHCVLGLLRCDSGRVVLHGKDVSRLPFYRRALLGLGYLPEQPSIYRGLSVADNILASLEIVEPDGEARSQRLEELLSDLGIAHLRDRRATSLSGGERRRCEVARALALDPSVLLLDEPLKGIDPLAVASIGELIVQVRQRGVAILITDQNVRETMAVIDRCYLLDEGRIAFAGSPEEMLHDERALARYLGQASGP
ncbi:LPS export ABC transporter ATP-binding protein [Erythrobacter sp.]|uniref:LPS export ABC transporter ATP-binding protein n=1 Tax=Erythrobacter sp. TaxID=1042 RepID=UPI001425FD36|nr:LPS export ABC transporter ATP-binding protein [Erythrobacter sp.]QIQ85702.1 MAG: LPS export ABC transporter ATP-binding protein [Erythrobacter sp.]